MGQIAWRGGALYVACLGEETRTTLAPLACAASRMPPASHVCADGIYVLPNVDSSLQPQSSPIAPQVRVRASAADIIGSHPAQCTLLHVTLQHTATMHQLPLPQLLFSTATPSSWHGRKGLAAPSWTPDLFFSTGSPCNFECSGTPARIAVCVLQRSRCCSNNRPLVLRIQPPVRASLSNHINSLCNPPKTPPPPLQGTAPSIARAPQT